MRWWWMDQWKTNLEQWWCMSWTNKQTTEKESGWNKKGGTTTENKKETRKKQERNNNRQETKGKQQGRETTKKKQPKRDNKESFFILFVFVFIVFWLSFNNSVFAPVGDPSESPSNLIEDLGKLCGRLVYKIPVVSTTTAKVRSKGESDNVIPNKKEGSCWSTFFPLLFWFYSSEFVVFYPRSVNHWKLGGLWKYWKG